MAIKRLLCAAAIIAASQAVLATPAAANELRITIDGFAGTGGFIMLGMFDSPETYDGEEIRFAERKEAVESESETLVFNDVPEGTYAIKLYHDENGSGDLDRNFVGIPTERYGFSNNPGTIGVPSFDQAAFTVAGDTEISITLR
jgi:uncharacterized protein (DUF2141 family)